MPEEEIDLPDVESYSVKTLKPFSGCETCPYSYREECTSCPGAERIIAIGFGIATVICVLVAILWYTGIIVID